MPTLSSTTLFLRGFFGIIKTMSKKDLAEFDSAAFAATDVALWKAYYNHHFFTMFWLLLKASYTFMGPSIRIIPYAYYSSKAAIIFRKTKHHETDATNQQIRWCLEKFYALVERHSVQSFDPRQAATAELAWWFIDRYPERYQKNRAQAFAEHKAIFHSVDPALLREYGQKRAAGMELLADYHHDTSYVVDWQQMEQLLRESYQSLYDVLHRQADGR